MDAKPDTEAPVVEETVTAFKKRLKANGVEEEYLERRKVLREEGLKKEEYQKILRLEFSEAIYPKPEKKKPLRRSSKGRRSEGDDGITDDGHDELWETLAEAGSENELDSTEAVEWVARYIDVHPSRIPTENVPASAAALLRLVMSNASFRNDFFKTILPKFKRVKDRVDPRTAIAKLEEAISACERFDREVAESSRASYPPRPERLQTKSPVPAQDSELGRVRRESAGVPAEDVFG